MLKCKFLGNILYPKSYIDIEKTILSIFKSNFMRRIFLFYTLLIFSNIVIAQDNTGSGEEQDANLFSFPVSPEAGRLGTYGNVPVNLSSGQVNFQVPIYNIDLRGYSWPIQLSYNFKGLVYEDKPSLTGLGWLLNAGGVVTREVRGIPDEHPFGYYGAQNILGRYLNPYFSNGDMTLITAGEIAAGNFDSEADKYYVSVNGVSFSFKVGLDKQPVYLSEHNYRVILNWYNQYELDSFVVIDDNGIHYFFNHKETNAPEGQNFHVFNDSFRQYTSSWNLSNVIFPNGEELTFQYITRNYYSYDFYASGYVNNEPVQCGFTQADSFKYNHGSTKTRITQNVLVGIQAPDVNINFGYPPIPVNDNSHRITYSSVNIQDKYSNTLLWDFDLFYEGARDLLTRIDRNGEHYYSFEYKNKLKVPPFLNDENDNAFKQDLWGFYNGVNNNYGVTMPGTPYEADKRASFTNTSAGALEKIVYPTKGYTIIDYEQNTVRKTYQETIDDNQFFAPNYKIHIEQQTFARENKRGYKEKSYQYTFNDTVVASITYKVEALPASFTGVSIEKIGGCEGATNGSTELDDYAEHLRAIQGEPIPAFCPRLHSVIDDGDIDGGYHDPVRKSGSTNGSIRIPPGTYKFKVWTNSSHEDTQGRIIVKFYLPPNPGSENSDIPLYANYAVGGIRVAKLTNYTVEGKVSDSKLYEYIGDDGYTSGEDFQKAIITYTNNLEHCCCQQSTTTTGVVHCGLSYFIRTNYTSKTYNPINLNQGVPVLYRKVRESKNKQAKRKYTGSMPDCNTPGCLTLLSEQNSNSILTYIGTDEIVNNNVQYYYYPNGYSEITFDYREQYQINYPVVPKGDDLDIGRLLRKTVYELGNTTLEKIKVSETINQYQGVGNLLNQDSFDPNPNHPTGLRLSFVTKKEGDCTLYPDEYNISDYFKIVKYRERNSRFLIAETKKSLYFPDTLTTIESFSYDYKNQLKQTITRDSENNTIVSTNFYTYDPETNDAGMSGDNILTPVLATKTTKNGTITNQTKLDYHKVNERTSTETTIYKPFKSWTAIGNEPLRGVIKYDQYDDYGNLLQYFKITKDGNPIDPLDPGSSADEGGIVTSAIWGYGYKYPVAQIVNASYDDAISHLSVSIEDLQNLDGEALRQELDNIRQALPEAQVTTYIYQPLVGLTSITDPKGYTIYYEYDHLYRLKFLKDEDNNILSENQYNYRD